MENIKETIQQSINAVNDAQVNATKTMYNALVKIARRHGNMYAVSNPDNKVTCLCDEGDMNILYLLAECNLEPNLIIVSRINGCANLNVSQFAHFSYKTQIAICNAVVNNETKLNKPEPTKVMATTKEPIYKFLNIDYDDTATVFVSINTNKQLLLPSHYEIDPMIGEVGVLRVLKDCVSSSEYDMICENEIASYMQVYMGDGTACAVPLYVVEFNHKYYNCRYASDTEGDTVVVAPDSLSAAMFEEIGDLDEEIDSEIAYYTDEDMLNALDNERLQKALHEECDDYFGEA